MWTAYTCVLSFLLLALSAISQASEFAPAVNYDVDPNPFFIASADFNGDGNLDLAVANADFSHVTHAISVLLGNGDGSFQNAVDYPVGLLPRGVAVGDSNGDGILDLVSADQDSDTISVLLGYGDGTFQRATSFASGPAPIAIALADFNGDGIIDVAVANFILDPQISTTSILVGNGDGSFQAPQSFPTSYRSEGLAVGDFNGDGCCL